MVKPGLQNIIPYTARAEGSISTDQQVHRPDSGLINGMHPCLAGRTTLCDAANHHGCLTLPRNMPGASSYQESERVRERHGLLIKLIHTSQLTNHASHGPWLLTKLLVAAMAGTRRVCKPRGDPDFQISGGASAVPHSKRRIRWFCWEPWRTGRGSCQRGHDYVGWVQITETRLSRAE